MSLTSFKLNSSWRERTQLIALIYLFRKCWASFTRTVNVMVFVSASLVLCNGHFDGQIWSPWRYVLTGFQISEWDTFTVKKKGDKNGLIQGNDWLSFRTEDSPHVGFSIRTYSHQVKVGAKAKKNKQQAKKIKEWTTHIKEKIRFFDVNGP